MVKRPPRQIQSAGEYLYLVFVLGGSLIAIFFYVRRYIKEKKTIQKVIEERRKEKRRNFKMIWMLYSTFVLQNLQIVRAEIHKSEATFDRSKKPSKYHRVTWPSHSSHTIDTFQPILIGSDWR